MFYLPFFFEGSFSFLKRNSFMKKENKRREDIKLVQWSENDKTNKMKFKKDPHITYAIYVFSNVLLLCYYTT